jgi:hypothetical protein
LKHSVHQVSSPPLIKFSFDPLNHLDPEYSMGTSPCSPSPAMQGKRMSTLLKVL